MYGLPQAGMLAKKLLKESPEEHGYYKLPNTPGLFTHKTRPIWFGLVVDDFGVKYVEKEHANHLMSILKELYKVKEEWMGLIYCGIKLDWHYEYRYLDISMPNYVQKQLLKYKWNPPKQPQFSPFNPVPINYCKKLNIIIPEPDSSPLTKDVKTYTQQVVGSFLYYS